MLDTNVLVAGLLKHSGPPGQVVALVVTGALTVLFDERILAEYRDVLPRAKLGLDPGDIEEVLRWTEAAGERIDALPLANELNDPDDLPLLEIAYAANADALVTGNRRHFPSDSRVPVLSPRALLDLLRGGPVA